MMIAALDLQSTRLSRAMAAHNTISEIIHALHESVIYIYGEQVQIALKLGT